MKNFDQNVPALDMVKGFSEMDIAIQSAKLVNHNTPSKAYSKIKAAGFDAIDYSIMYSDNFSRVDYSYIEREYECARNEGLYFCQAHEPLWRKPVDLRRDNSAITSMVRMSIDVCRILKSPYLVVHPYQFSSEVEKDEQRELNMAFFTKMGKIAQDNGVILCIENKPNTLNGSVSGGVCSTSNDLCEYVDELNDLLGSECFGACFDTGHANLLRKDMRQEVVTLGKRLKVLHIHDNDGSFDYHQLPFAFCRNAVDFSSFLIGLRDIGYRGALSFETYQAILATPGMLRNSLLSYIKNIGDLLAKVICFEQELEKRKDKNIIIFGAGKMLKMYMKQFGEKYAPLFAVDNNEALWGRNAYGVLIKNPQEIKRVENSQVIICSMYYEEIENQLEEMGVYNYILSEEIYRMKGIPYTDTW